MNTMRHVVFLLTNVIIIIVHFNPIDGIHESNGCSDQEYSPLCFCRSSDQHSILTDRFLAKLSLSQCDGSLSIRHCRQSRFHPPSFHLTELIPQLTNLSHCLKDTHCLHTLHFIQHCQQCQVIPLLLTLNSSYRTDACFNICQKHLSCGFVCLNQPIILSIICNICRGRNQNISCRCIKSSSSCLPLSFETTTLRWMQKRGFPAAGILVLLMLVIALFVMAIELTYRQLDIIDRRRSIAMHQLILSQQSRQLLSTHLNTPQIVVEIHQCDEENELFYY